MKPSWWTRYVHIHRVANGICPACGGEGAYNERKFPCHFWVYFNCSTCGYELREHVRTSDGEEANKEEVEVGP